MTHNQQNRKLTINCNQNNLNKIIETLIQNFDIEIDIKSEHDNSFPSIPLSGAHSTEVEKELTMTEIETYLKSKNKTFDMIDKFFINTASYEGRLDVIKWFHKNFDKSNEIFTEYVMNLAAANGHLDIVIWLHENRKEGCTANAINWAAEEGHLDIVIWLHENRKEGFTTFAIDWAAQNGHTNIVNYLQSKIKN